MNKTIIKEMWVEKVWSLLRKAHKWHTKSELRRWKLKDLREICEELEGVAVK